MHARNNKLGEGAFCLFAVQEGTFVDAFAGSEEPLMTNAEHTFTAKWEAGGLTLPDFSLWLIHKKYLFLPLAHEACG